MLVIEQSPITTAHRQIPAFTQDPAIRWWAGEVGAQGTHALYPAHDAVIIHAQSELAKLTRLPRGWDGRDGHALRTIVADSALTLIRLIVRADGLATPQFSPLPCGGVNIVWLVAGDQLTIAFEDGELSFYGLWASGQEAFDYQLASVIADPILGKEHLRAAVTESREFLEKISTGIQHQLIPQ